MMGIFQKQGCSICTLAFHYVDLFFSPIHTDSLVLVSVHTPNVDSSRRSHKILYEGNNVDVDKECDLRLLYGLDVHVEQYIFDTYY